MHLLAYIDPGSGSLFVQAVIATVLVVPFFLRSQIRKGIDRIRGSGRRPRPPDSPAARRRRSSTAALTPDPGGRVTSSNAPGTAAITRDPGSFRDPSGFVFRRDGVLYRQVNRVFADDWKAAVDAGVLRRWQESGRLVDHEVVDISLAADPDRALAVLRPDPSPSSPTHTSGRSGS